MPPRDITPELQEAFRRRAGGSPNLAGIPQGNLNPQAGTSQQVMASRLPEAPQSLQPQQMASQPGIDQLQKSQPGEAEIILKALTQRLRNLPPAGGVNVQQ